MSNRTKIKIFFFTPFGGYTGSEVSITNLIKQLDPQKFEIRLYAMNKGELLDSLPDQIITYYYKGIGGLGKRIVSKIITMFTGNTPLEREVMSIHNEFKPDIWYLNTVLLTGIVDIACKNEIKYAVHFHELLKQYNYVSADKMEKMISRAAFAVGCCEDVCNNLKILGASRVLKQYECIDTASIIADAGKIQRNKKELGIPEGHNVITMSGQRTEIKGFDIFIKVAKELKDKPYFFLWLGGLADTGFAVFLEKFIAYHKLTNIKIVRPSREEYYNYLAISDVFFLSSREDSFPLVMLESAFLGKYIVSLNSGGVKEFLDENSGYIINSMNVADIANELHTICQQRENITGIEKSKELALKFDVLNQISPFEALLSTECTK
jgi:glycosyltransferase involved in cell wall biosynthesis